MSVQGQLYNSYDNFASGQLYASVGDVGNVSQHQANQFMQSFGGYGNHVPVATQKNAQAAAPAQGAGIGMRVELNDNKELYVSKVNPGGSAERDGTIRVGDILMTVNGENVRGKKLSQLRPLIVGPKGTFAALGLKRYTGGPSNLDEYTEYTVELVRGDPIFFLEAENAKGKMKLQAMRKTLVEVDVELDGLRSVLEQAEGRAKIEDTEVQSMQERYDSIQGAIQRCNEQIQEEKRMKEKLKTQVPTQMDPEKLRVRELHEKLSRLETQLNEVMNNLEEEHQESMQINEKVDQERALADMVNGKLGEHQTMAEKMREETQARDRGFVQTKQQHEEAIADLRARVADAQRRREVEAAQASAAPEEEERANAGLRAAEEERRSVEAQLIQVREELTAEDAAVRQTEAEQAQLEQRRHELAQRAAIVDKVLEEARGKLDTLQRDKGRELNQRDEDMRAARDLTQHALVDLEEQLEKLKKRNDDLVYFSRSAEEEAAQAERERARELAQMHPRAQAQEEEMRRMRAEVEQREADLENVKREVEQSLLDERTVLEAADRASSHTDAVTASAEALHHQLQQLNADVRAKDAELEDIRQAEQELTTEFRRAVEEERQRVRDLEFAREDKDAESKRTYSSLLQLSDLDAHVKRRAGQYAELHQREMARVGGALAEDTGLRARLKAVGSVSGDMLFADSGRLSQRLNASIDRFRQIKGDYEHRRAILDSRASQAYVPVDARPGVHTRQLLQSQQGMAVAEAAWEVRPAPAPNAAPASYTAQLLRSGPPSAPSSGPPSAPSSAPTTHIPADIYRPPSAPPAPTAPTSAPPSSARAQEQAAQPRYPNIQAAPTLAPVVRTPVPVPVVHAVAAQPAPPPAAPDTNGHRSGAPQSVIGSPASQTLTAGGGVAKPTDGRHRPDADGVIRLRVATDYVSRDNNQPLRKGSPESKKETGSLEQRIDEMTEELMPQFPDALFYPMQTSGKTPTIASLM